jgi:hypothetical protein
MTAEEAIYIKLLATTPVTALVVGRVYPNYLPENASLAAIVYQRISGPRIHNMSGTSGTASPRIQITSWGATYKKAKELSAAVRVALDGFSGTITQSTTSSLKIQSCLLQNELDMPELAPLDDALRRFGVVQDYIIWHDE